MSRASEIYVYICYEPAIGLEVARFLQASPYQRDFFLDTGLKNGITLSCFLCYIFVDWRAFSEFLQ